MSSTKMPCPHCQGSGYVDEDPAMKALEAALLKKGLTWEWLGLLMGFPTPRMPYLNGVCITDQCIYPVRIKGRVYEFVVPLDIIRAQNTALLNQEAAFFVEQVVDAFF